jgi:predicted nuclease of restriction endonuclease-like (RecB) superfamily
VNKKKGINTFNDLINTIQDVDKKLAAQASRTVNISLTLRNWLIGLRIFEYQQKGRDRMVYGDFLLEKLAKELQSMNISRVDIRELRRYRLFYLVYPQIRETLSPELRKSLLPDKDKRFPQKTGNTGTRGSSGKPIDIVTKLSFSHISELISIENDSKRDFYEVECIQGGWSVRELERQINSLYYERCGLSKNKKKLAVLTQAGAEMENPALNIRDPYIFEFLGIKPREVMSESRLEAALTDKMQDFLLELGHGFCFEARQKRILIGNENGFVDLVFYHRILKCHVLVELKTGKFSHENIGQLNTYVSWYKKNIMQKGDNPPVGILLCTGSDHALVEYALAGMDNKLFVSKYKVHMPSEKELLRELEKEKDDFLLKEESAGYEGGKVEKK